MTKRAVYAPGLSNRFHIGHLPIGRHKRGSCDYLTATNISDETVVGTRDEAPVIPALERLMVMLHIVFVDETIVETSPGKPDAWAEKPFDVTFKRYDWHRTPKDKLPSHDLPCEEVQVFYLPNAVHSPGATLTEALDNAAW